MDIYRQEMILLNQDVNMYRRLFTSRLFEILQEASIKHTELLGAGREHTLDKGILWVVTLQRAEIIRIPEYDEKIVIETWPGATMHVLFPRYYRVLDEKNNVIISASAIWALVDEKNRKLVFPSKYGVEIPGVVTGNEIELPTPPLILENTNKFSFTVPFSYTDLNGHMNNTRYFDLAEDIIPASREGKQVKKICTEYSAELCANDTVDIMWGQKDSVFYISGEGEKTYFKMSMKY